jgi:putative DNA primase/helicase
MTPEQRALAASLNGKPPDPDPFPLLSIADLDNLPPLEWLISGWLPARALTELYGPSGGGKSFLVLAWALCIASGCDWLGLPVKQGPVLYIAAEGVSGLRQRVHAWCAQYDSAPPERIRFLPDAVDLLDNHDLARAMLTLEQMDEAPALIIVDTMARCMPGADENSTRDVGLLIHNLDQLRKAADEAAGGIVHHTGKRGEEERGSSAGRGACDSMALLSDPGGGLRLTCTKPKDWEAPKDLALRLVKAADSCQIELGHSRSEIEVVRNLVEL